MYRALPIVLAILSCVNSRHLIQDNINPYLLVEDGPNVRVYSFKGILSEEPEVGESHHRLRRQAHGSLSSNPDGSSNFAAKLPLAGSDKNILSAISTVNGASNGGFKAAGGGMAWDSVKGHGATLTGQHIPGFGDQLTAAGKLNLFHNDKHDVTANAFGTRTFPSNPNIPSFDTYGGNLGYMYNNKVGASLGAAHTDLFKKTDYSAMGNLNLFRNRDSSLDFNAGFSKSVSPYIPSSRWQPSGGLSFSRFF